MNPNRDSDAVMAAWLDDGPAQLPADTRQAIAVGIRTVSRRRPGISWPAVTRPRLAPALAGAAAVVVMAALALNYIANQQGLGGPVTSPSPTARPTLTAPPFGLAGNGVIALAKDGDIFVADRPGGDTRPLLAGPENDSVPMFSPDGTKLIFMRSIDAQRDDEALMIADADGTNVVQIATEASFGAESRSGWSFAPDGRSLMAVAQIDNAMRVVIRPVDPTEALTVLDVRLLDGWMLLSWAIPTFNPTNAQEILLVARLEPDGPQGGGLYVYDLATGGIRTIVEPAEDQYFTDIAWLPDGEHIVYNSSIIRADGSGGQALEALRGRRFSPLSNDGTRIVVEDGGEGAQSPRPAIVPINGVGEPVVLACGPATDIECPSSPTDWIWSPDDSMLIGIFHHETSNGSPLETYLLVDANTGLVTELDWRDVGIAWQRVAP